MCPAFDVLMRILDHHHRRIDHCADGNGDAAQRHDVGVNPLEPHDDEGCQHAQRQGDNCHQCRPCVPQKQQADDADNDEFLEQFMREVFNRGINQLRPIVGRNDLHPVGQACLELVELCLHCLDRAAGICPLPQDDDAARDFAFAVKLGNAAPQFRSDLDGSDITQSYRHTACRGPQRDAAKISQIAEVAGSTDHIFRLSHLDDRAARFLVRRADRGDDFGMGDAQRSHAIRVEHDLILLHHAADAGDFGDAGHSLQFVAQEPVLQAAQASQIMPAAAVDQRIFVNPANPGRVRAKCAGNPVGQGVLHLVKVFEHARTRPVKVRPVLENHVDITVPEEGIAAHRFRAGHRQHGGGHWIGHLVLDNLRCLSGVIGANDDLHIRQVGQGIYRRFTHRP